MKKNKVILLVMLVLLLTGCGTDIKCSNSYEENIKYDMEITADVSKDKVVNATASMKFENSEDATTMCNLKKLMDLETVEVVCREKEVLIRNYQKLMLINNEKDINKKQFVERLKKDGFKC